MKIRQLKLNAKLLGNEAGSVIKVKCDDNGVPLESFWRKRVEDSKTDNCVEFVSETSTKKQKAEG